MLLKVKFGFIMHWWFMCCCSLCAPAIRGKQKKVVINFSLPGTSPFGRGGEVVQATMELIGIKQEVTNSELKCNIKDDKDGTYLISVIPQSVSEYQLSIKVENEHVKSSPFIVSVREPPIPYLHFTFWCPAVLLRELSL